MQVIFSVILNSLSLSLSHRDTIPAHTPYYQIPSKIIFRVIFLHHLKWSDGSIMCAKFQLCFQPIIWCITKRYISYILFHLGRTCHFEDTSSPLSRDSKIAQPLPFKNIRICHCELEIKRPLTIGYSMHCVYEMQSDV